MVTNEATTVDDFIRALDPKRRAIVVQLRTLINKAAPKAEASIKWGNPWWTQDGNLCCVYTAGDHVNFGFSRGVELTDKSGLLEGTGKGMRHIKIRTLDEILEKTILTMVRQAVKLNRSRNEE